MYMHLAYGNLLSHSTRVPLSSPARRAPLLDHSLPKPSPTYPPDNNISRPALWYNRNLGRKFGTAKARFPTVQIRCLHSKHSVINSNKKVLCKMSQPNIPLSSKRRCTRPCLDSSKNITQLNSFNRNRLPYRFHAPYVVVPHTVTR
jgi:hypothetical protein